MAISVRPDAHVCDAKRLIEAPHASSYWQKLNAVLEREQPAAEATLGRPLIAPLLFAADCLDPKVGLGEALNREQQRIDQLCP